MSSPFTAMEDLNRKQVREEVLRYAGTLGGIKALVGMVAEGSRTAEEIMPTIQEALAEHDREVERARAEHRRQIEPLRAQVAAYVEELRRQIDRYGRSDKIDGEVGEG